MYILLYHLLYHITLLKLVSNMYMICLFRQIAFSFYLIDVKGPRTNLLHIHYLFFVTCIMHYTCIVIIVLKTITVFIISYYLLLQINLIQRKTISTNSVKQI